MVETTTSLVAELAADAAFLDVGGVDFMEIAGPRSRAAPGWFACEQPEKATDPFVTWHYHTCESCKARAMALEAAHPDDPHVAWLVKTMGMNHPS